MFSCWLKHLTDNALNVFNIIALHNRRLLSSAPLVGQLADESEKISIEFLISHVPTRIGANVLGRRLSGSLYHCWQATPTVHWHPDTVSTKNKDHAGDEEFRGRRSIHLEQFTSRSANRNSLPIDVRSTSEGPPVRLIDSASEDHL